MIKIDNYHCNVEGNLETVLNDFRSATSAVYNILIKTYGFDKKDAKYVLKYGFKSALKDVEVAEYQEMEIDE